MVISHLVGDGLTSVPRPSVPALVVAGTQLAGAEATQGIGVGRYG